MYMYVCACECVCVCVRVESACVCVCVCDELINLKGPNLSPLFCLTKTSCYWSQATPQAPPPGPKRTGSLALFYRKVYQLAYIRIRDLCDRLELGPDTMQK